MFFLKKNISDFSILFVVVMTVIAFLGPRTNAFGAGRQQLHGHLLDVTKTVPVVRHLEGATHLNFAIGLPFRNQAALQYLLKELYDPNSPNYRRFLTPEKFAQMFGPTEADYQAVINFAEAHNLTVTKTYCNGALVDVRGTSQDVEKAFYVHLNNYQRPDGSTFFASDVEPSLDLDVSILHVSGLDDFARPRPMMNVSLLKKVPDLGKSIMNDRAKTNLTPNIIIRHVS